MSDGWVDVRTPLAVSENVRVEVGDDGRLHVVTALLTLHFERQECEELTTTMARALVRLHKLHKPRRAQPTLRVVGAEAVPSADESGSSD